MNLDQIFKFKVNILLGVDFFHILCYNYYSKVEKRGGQNEENK